MAGFVLWLLAGSVFAADCTLAEFPKSAHRVSRTDLLAAMQKETAKGYNLLVSTNASRFNSAVLLDLARSRAALSDSSAFRIGYDDWYEAFRLAMKLDSAAVPKYVDLQRIHHQNRYAMPTKGLEVEEGPTPMAVLRVWSGWPDSAGAAHEYTLIDTAASPDMEVTNENCVSYWLVDYGDIVVNDRIAGVRGRPLEGALALAFKLIGSGHADWSRSILADDGVAVTWSRAGRGPFSAKLTTTTWPTGRLEKGIPDNRPDLKELEQRLKKPMALRYPDN